MQFNRTLHAIKQFPARLLWTAKNIPAGLRGELLVAHSELSLVHIKADGTRIDHGVVSRKKVSIGFVKHIVAALMYVTDDTRQGLLTLNDFKYHGCGTDATAEGASGVDYKLGTETVLITRPTGVNTDQSTAGAAILQSVATYTFTTTLAIVEHGLFNATDRNTTTVNGAQAANTTPLLVTSTTGFSGTGNVYSQGQTIKYTSVDATHFIGCTEGNSAITLANAIGIAASELLDRSVFAAVNVVSGDSIQFTYQLTINPET